MRGESKRKKRRRQRKKGGKAETREHRRGKGRDELGYWEKGGRRSRREAARQGEVKEELGKRRNSRGKKLGLSVGSRSRKGRKEAGRKRGEMGGVRRNGKCASTVRLRKKYGTLGNKSGSGKGSLGERAAALALPRGAGVGKQEKELSREASRGLRAPIALVKVGIASETKKSGLLRRKGREQRRGSMVPRRETKRRKKGGGVRETQRGVGEKRGEYRRGEGLRGGVRKERARAKTTPGNGTGRSKAVWVERSGRRVEEA
jgi:hypothetical protein